LPAQDGELQPRHKQPVGMTKATQHQPAVRPIHHGQQQQSRHGLGTATACPKVKLGKGMPFGDLLQRLGQHRPRLG
jgi:hypothetical protein